MTESEKTNSYDVHVYRVIRVKVTDIEAENHQQAIEKAEEAVGRIELNKINGFEAEDAEETAHYLVDDAKPVREALYKQEKDEYENTVWYSSDGKTPLASSDTPHVVVSLHNSTVRQVLMDRPMHVTVVDTDIDGMDDEDKVMIDSKQHFVQQLFEGGLGHDAGLSQAIDDKEVHRVVDQIKNHPKK